MSEKKRGRPPKIMGDAILIKGERVWEGIESVETNIKVPEKPIEQISAETLSKLVLKGDLSGLSQEQKMEYYLRLCEHLGLDPVTRPFDILNIRGKEIMYAHKGCTDQLRKKYGVSVTDVRGEPVGDVYRVVAIGKDHTGRTDASSGCVSLGNLKGDDLANALMKAETKAKRRLTLSLCGLGMLDESEIETIPNAEIKAVFDLPAKATNSADYGAAPKTAPKPTAPPTTEMPKMDRQTLLGQIKEIVDSGAFTSDEITAARETAKTADAPGLERLRQSMAEMKNSRTGKLDSIASKAFAKIKEEVERQEELKELDKMKAPAIEKTGMGPNGELIF